MLCASEQDFKIIMIVACRWKQWQLLDVKQKVVEKSADTEAVWDPDYFLK